ncbi:hypothetical protein SAMN02746066_01847 [Anaerosporobacter mobilis DSM 15930]|jgi:hypothetical protein|uniref:Uncharacterized protein n=1 Tax=Anaerosporobacter mobilis DSM 15930 TaxID=1120996 RepID=A0A1M7IGH7_9FIRM|nr:hypothetical protein [Anaerosporobacter mobilis]SHM39810.1 hypothetical protein SAMN02746066_01847 [Anaerosporobacter mobilis DSM 15930]
MQIEEKYLSEFKGQKFLLLEDMEEFVKKTLGAYDAYGERNILYVIMKRGDKEELELNYSFYDKNYHLEV